MTAPECTIPNVTFSAKWLFTMAVPLFAAGLFLLVHVMLYIKKRLILNRTTKLHTHVDALVATFLTIMYDQVPRAADSSVL